MASVGCGRHWVVGESSILGRDGTLAFVVPPRHVNGIELTCLLENYMQNPPHHGKDETPGALNLGQSTATRVYCAFYIFYYTAPIFFAILADSRLGRYTTLVMSVILYCIGWAILTASSVPSSIDGGWGLSGLIVSMVLVGLGGGGFRAIMVPFIADQYTETEPRIITLKTGEQVITDRQLTLQYIYNLYYWIGNLGSLSWFCTVYMESHSGFASAYGLTLGFMILSMVMLIFGRHWYVRVPHEGNVVPTAVRIVTCAGKNGFKMAHADPAWQLKNRDTTVPWTGQLVAEITRGLQACRVLLVFVVFYVCFDQMQNNLISQAGEMEAHGTPNDLISAINQVGCIVFGPLIQEVLYPFLHRRRIYLQPVTRISIGFIFVALGMLYATVVQHAIYSTGGQVNIWVQAPLYILISIGEIFAMVTAMEYAYEYAPANMKVIVQAISLLIAGMGSAVAMALTPVAQDPYLVVFYASLTGAMTLATVVFWFLFRHHDKESALETFDEGAVETDEDSVQTDLEKSPAGSARGEEFGKEAGLEKELGVA
jgi:POT family proton-dependent oligopeptide transporter